MTTGYLPILVYAAVVALFAVLSVAASSLLRPHRPRPAKLAPYECGITPERLPAGERYPVKFYVIAMLFIIFDVEAIFLYPWAVAFRGLGLFGLVEMVVFIGLVLVAYVYVRQKGGFEWEGLDRPIEDEGEEGARPSPVGPPALEDLGGAGRRPEPVGSGRA